MKKYPLFALIAIIFGSCGTSKVAVGTAKDSTTVAVVPMKPVLSETIIDFTKSYRDYFTDQELTSREHASFLNKSTLELVGLPADSKSIYFENSALIEGNYQHIVLPAGTYGKMVNVLGPNTFQVQFSEKDSIRFVFMLDKSDTTYGLGVKTDLSPRIAPGILKKYTFTPSYQYVEYRGARYYFISGKNVSRLQVDQKMLEPEHIQLEDMK